jgi:hypothetical protein
MADTRAVQQADDARFIICLDGIKNPAREAFEKCPGRIPVYMRVNAVHRFAGTPGLQHFPNA